MFRKFLINCQDYIDNYSVHLINTLFLSFSVIIITFGSLIIAVESFLPTFIKKTIRYGKHKCKDDQNSLLNRLEVPKSWFAHFYIFAFGWSICAFYLVLKGIIMHNAAPDAVIAFLDLFGGGRNQRKVLIKSNEALITTLLMTLQCIRRFYETNFVQIFSSKQKIHLSHYIVGYLHYFGAILALLINTEGFVKDSLPSTFSFTKITLIQYMCLALFHFSWSQQWKTNMILVNLRKDSKTGKINSEHHLMPRGGLFEMVSSPHMFFEIQIYVAVMGILYQSLTWKLIVIWVTGNQIVNALLTHKWYKENFKNYPKNRKAIIPFLL
uniref:Polyprenal reductase n=1 Tax=Glossina brevipalpis TaxID=37001 RepID=A0A1A9WM31_9MUSC